MFKNVLRGLAALVVAGCLSAPAHAVVMKATYFGTASGADISGHVFGTDEWWGEDDEFPILKNLPFVLTVKYDTQMPGAIYENYDAPEYQQFGETIHGGSYDGAASPIISSVLTLRGKSFAFQSDYTGGVFVISQDDALNGKLRGFGHTIDGNSGFIDAYYYTRDVSLFDEFPDRLNNAATINLVGQPRGDPPLGFYYHDYSYDIAFSGSLSLSKITVTPVPVPTSLPLISSGLVMLGLWSARRDRKRLRVGHKHGEY
jgi:hypothetical protein